MPTLTQEQLTEIEIEIADLLEEVEALRIENASLKEALLRVRKERDG